LHIYPPDQTWILSTLPLHKNRNMYCPNNHQSIQGTKAVFQFPPSDTNFIVLLTPSYYH